MFHSNARPGPRAPSNGLGETWGFPGGGVTREGTPGTFNGIDVSRCLLFNEVDVGSYDFFALGVGLAARCRRERAIYRGWKRGTRIAAEQPESRSAKGAKERGRGRVGVQRRIMDDQRLDSCSVRRAGAPLRVVLEPRARCRLAVTRARSPGHRQGRSAEEAVQAGLRVVREASVQTGRGGRRRAFVDLADHLAELLGRFL